MKVIASHTIRIWIAGDYQDACRVARQFCSTEGACFALAPCDYIYSGGQEAGVCVTLIHYPRFPSTPEALMDKAQRLAIQLQHGLFQRGYTIEGPDFTEFYDPDVPAIDTGKGAQP